MNNRNDLRNVSISHGTLRTDDLADAIIRLMYRTGDVWAKTYADELFQLDDEWERTEYLHDTLWTWAESIAPEGCYFGAHPGDGSDFGFWEADDDQ